MIVPSQVYATDEDVALRASADFSLLCPRDQTVAYGSDGVFGADPWTLSSASVFFLAAGVSAGQLVRLTRPSSTFRPPGDLLAIGAVDAGDLRLRRKGMAAGIGQPPGPVGGVQDVEFTIATLGPQIATASYDLNRRFGIDDMIAGRRPCDLFDIREVRDATVLTVLSRQYLELSRGALENGDSFLTKARAYRQELDDLLARLVIHWAPTAGTATSVAGTTRMSTRLSR